MQAVVKGVIEWMKDGQVVKGGRGSKSAPLRWFIKDKEVPNKETTSETKDSGSNTRQRDGPIAYVKQTDAEHSMGGALTGGNNWRRRPE